MLPGWLLSVLLAKCAPGFVPPLISSQPPSPSACVSFPFFMFGADRENRICGAQSSKVRHPNLCHGSTIDGELSHIGEREMQRRCIDDDVCVAYSRSHKTPRSFIPVSGWAGRSPRICEWDTFRKDDLCPVHQQTGHERIMARIASAVDAWAVRTLHAMNQNAVDARNLHAMHAHLAEVRAFGEANVAPAVHKLPVFYPFSGADLLTAISLFPRAPRYVLAASLPPGDPRCFLSADCMRGGATFATTKFFGHWASKHFAWSETSRMLQRFATPHVDTSGAVNHTYSSVGVLPVLALSLRVAGHRVASVLCTGASEVTLTTDRGVIVTFAGIALLGRRPLAADLALLEAPIRAPAVVTLIKAAEGAMYWLGRDNVTAWLLRRSAAVVHDETGLPPWDYAQASWSVRAFGNFSALDGAYRRWHIDRPFALGSSCTSGHVCSDDAADLWSQRMSTVFRDARELPIAFGYGTHELRADKRARGGVLLIATRKRPRVEAES